MSLVNADLFMKVAGWIEKSATPNEFPGGYLPSRRILAKSYGVSESTIQKALKYLAHKGVIRCTRGRPPEIVGIARDPAPPPRSRSSADRIAERVEAEIRGGILKAGDHLPKIDSFVKTYHVSSHTVVRAFRGLIRKDIIHKDGRRHVVGTPIKSPGNGRKTGNSYVILALLLDSRTWLNLQSPRTAQFVHAFLNELEPRHLQLQPVYLDYPRAWENTVNGPQAIVSYAENLGSRYLGAVVPLRSKTLSPTAPVIEQLLRLDRPVIWVDAVDERNVPQPRNRRFYRCLFSEEKAVYPAVEALAKLGHHSVGYAYEETTDWQYKRAAILESSASDFGIKIHRYPIKPSQFRNRFRQLDSLLRLFEKEKNPELTERIKMFRSNLPDWESRLRRRETESTALSDFEMFLEIFDKDFESLKPCFEEVATIFNIAIYGRHLLHMDEHEVTAQVLPSDGFSKRPVACLHMLGVSFPEKLSLLTFDNYDPRRIIPISSVDFGFGSLGYWAFHAIAGDLPLPIDRRGTIRAQPFINDKGSLAAPRRSPMLSGKTRNLLQKVVEVV